MRGDGLSFGLDSPAAHRRAPQQQFENVCKARARHGLRLHRRIQFRGPLGKAPRRARIARESRADNPLQPAPQGQRSARDHARQLSGFYLRGQAANRLGLVVSRPVRRNQKAARGTVTAFAFVEFRRNGHRLAFVPLVPAPRIFPQDSLQHSRHGNGGGRAARRPAARRRMRRARSL